MGSMPSDHRQIVRAGSFMPRDAAPVAVTPPRRVLQYIAATEAVRTDSLAGRGTLSSTGPANTRAPRSASPQYPGPRADSDRAAASARPGAGTWGPVGRPRAALGVRTTRERHYKGPVEVWVDGAKKFEADVHLTKSQSVEEFETLVGIESVASDASA